MRSARFIVAIASTALILWGFGTASAAPKPKNLIPNEGFEDGVVQPWTSYGQAQLSMADRKDAYEGTEALKIEVGAKGVNFWDSGVQFKDNITFDKDTTYTWAMFFKSDPPVKVNIKPELGVDPWTAYGEKQVQLTGDYQEYWTTWTPPKDVVPASLTLHVAFDVATIWMDNPRWYVGEYEPANGEPQSVDPAGKLATTWATLKSRT